METKEHFPLTSHLVVAEKRTESRSARRLRTFWITMIGVCGLTGIASGITGLMLSLLTAVGIVARTRSVSIAVSILIVVALGLLLTAAHAMDRTDGVS